MESVDFVPFGLLGRRRYIPTLLRDPISERMISLSTLPRCSAGSIKDDRDEHYKSEDGAVEGQILSDGDIEQQTTFS
jgi:hypothetical protein